jgi:hypothetical protein
VAGELLDQSSSRNGATVIWVVIHTAEGPTDSAPGDPRVDAGSAEDLLAFFEPKTDRSCHAIADDDHLLDALVPYDREAWTLRGGNPRSDNLEMCALASWSRAEWLDHLPMLRIAARWVAGRLKARGLPNHRVSVAECAARSVGGFMDHYTYTKATGDGTHWDVGPNFPWDVFDPLVTKALTGAPLDEEDDVTAEEVWAYGVKNPDTGAVMKASDRLLDTERRILATQSAVSAQGKVLATAVATLGALQAAVKTLAESTAAGVDYDRLTEIVDAAAERAVSGIEVTFVPPADATPSA